MSMPSEHYKVMNRLRQRVCGCAGKMPINAWPWIGTRHEPNGSGFLPGWLRHLLQFFWTGVAPSLIMNLLAGERDSENALRLDRTLLQDQLCSDLFSFICFSLPCSP